MDEDVWHTFPAQMGEHRAFISFNESFAKIADKDARNILLKVRVSIKSPAPNGMPTNNEFPALREVDEKIEGAFVSNGGVYVGRLTVDGGRHFFYYVAFPERIAAESVKVVSEQTGYELKYAYEEDPEKKGYWNDLYPTQDDWQVLKDLRVLDALAERGDKAEVEREVSHWAYFGDRSAAESFEHWAAASGYRVTGVDEAEEGGDRLCVRFSHAGSMRLEDITHHTIGLNRKVTELKGDYDGWETSVEK
jgi:hypothetical protein